MLKVIIYWLNRLSIRFPPRWIWSSLSSFIILTNKNLETEDLCETDLTFNESPLFDCTQFFSSCQPICSRRGFSKSFLYFVKQAYLYSNWTLNVKRAPDTSSLLYFEMLSFIKKLLGRNLFFKRKYFMTYTYVHYLVIYSYIVVIWWQAWSLSYLRIIKNIKK